MTTSFSPVQINKCLLYSPTAASHVYAWDEGANDLTTRGALFLRKLLKACGTQQMTTAGGAQRDRFPAYGTLHSRWCLPLPLGGSLLSFARFPGGLEFRVQGVHLLQDALLVLRVPPVLALGEFSPTDLPGFHSHFRAQAHPEAGQGWEVRRSPSPPGWRSMFER